MDQLMAEDLVGKWVTCVRVGVYQQALTKGKKYQVINLNAEKNQIRIKGDNTRHRWYSTWYFDLSGEDAVLLDSIHLDDPLHDPLCDAIEVTLIFSDGNQRWCLCATPAYFQRYLEQGIQPKEKEHEGFQWIVLQFFGSTLTTKAGKDFMAFNIPHLVMFSELSEDIIWTTMKHMDDQGELEASSVPLGHLSDQQSTEN